MASLRYQPPAVRYPAPVPRWLLWLGMALWLLEAVLLLLWQLLAGPLAWTVVLPGWLCWAGVGLVWWRSLRSVPQGALQWDGGAWWWWPQSGAEPIPLQAVQVRLDLQSAMWIAWQAADGVWRFSWLQARSDAAIWGDWRRAVYSAATVSAFQQERV
ncbi:MAG: hypothetical protein LBV14_15940 [Acidovorax sp.]|jgi:hypothetical protein|nr:hypothetical protein [Acidovorax sp.]